MDIRPNSEKVMSMLYDSVEKIDEIKRNQDKCLDVFSEKLKIVDTTEKYINSMLLSESVSGKHDEKDNRYIFNYDKHALVGGRYDSFGQVVHAKFIKIPGQVFNYITETYPVYTNNGVVEFYTDEENKDIKKEYQNILKHEGCVDKYDVFKTFKGDTITMAVQFNTGDMNWNKPFDMIELAPYLQGSFDITSIRIYTADQYYAKDMIVPKRTITERFTNIGLTRIKLDKKYDFYRVEFDIKINYKDDGYPFGLRHLYFYDSAADSENDYLVLEINKNDYIRYVGDDLSIITTHGNINTTKDAYGIEYYMLYQGGALQVPLNNPIARNITKFYVKIPLREPLIGIEFKEILTK